jgi:hypothetical protein
MFGVFFFLGVRILYFVMLKRIPSVIASVLAPSGVDRGFEPQRI